MKTGDRVRSTDDGMIGTIHEATFANPREGWYYVVWDDNSADWDNSVVPLTKHEEMQCFLDSISEAETRFSGLDTKHKAFMLLVAATMRYKLDGSSLDGLLLRVESLWKSNEISVARGQTQ